MRMWILLISMVVGVAVGLMIWYGVFTLLPWQYAVGGIGFLFFLGIFADPSMRSVRYLMLSLIFLGLVWVLYEAITYLIEYGANNGGAG